MYSTSAIVLRRRDAGEWDRLYTVYTREHGKLTLLGKGTRRPRAKLAAHLEPYAEVDLVVAHGRAIDRMTSAVSRRSGEAFATSLERATAAACVAEVTDVLTRTAERDSAIFELLQASLDAIAGDPHNVVTPFVIRLLSCLGYAPEMVRCVECRSSVPAGPATADPARGGVVCVRCRRTHPDTIMVTGEDRQRCSFLATTFTLSETSSTLMTFAWRQLASHLAAPLRSVTMLTGDASLPTIVRS